MKKLFILLALMTCFSLSSYAVYMCSGVTYNTSTNSATAVLCAEDYNTFTVGDDPTTMNVNLISGINYAIEGRVELEQVEYMDMINIQELDVNGSVVNTLASYSSEIQNNIRLYTRQGTGRIVINIYCFYGATCETSGFEFTIRPMETMDTEQMYVTDRLGIGTTSPTEALDVRGKVKISNGSSTIVINPNNTQITTTSPFLYVNKPIMNTGEFRSANNTNLTLSTYTTPRMTILSSNGNVGIGTVTPQQRLHVEGGVKIGSTTTAEDRQQNVLSFGDGEYVKIGEFESDDKLSFRASRYNFTNGNVGINLSTNPTYRLHVNGNIYGTEILSPKFKSSDSIITPNLKATNIVADDIYVRSTSGADYVFDNDYNLRSLQDVKTFINTNKHLPEIPSAEEMQQDGVNMNQLQIQLLQKIEELTLYIIQQEERIKELETLQNK